MTTLVNWISPGTMQALGWGLLHFVWQGTALAAVSVGAMALSRRTQTRYIIGVAMLVLMLVVPIWTVAFYMQPHLPAPTDATILSTAPQVAHSASYASSLNPSGQASSIRASLDVLSWLVEAWLIGVAFFSLRSAGGFVLLERERRRQSSVVEDRILETCHTLQDRLGIKRAIQYCECAWLQAPAVIGWFRPIVFLPMSALTGLSEAQLQSVIAHELAHIQRFDPFVNVFQVCVETLLFYHPAVWWLNKRIRAEREHCCDDTAVSVCGDAVEYARALTLMEEWRSAPTLAMAANRGPLKERIVRVLGLKTLGAGMRSVGLMGSLLCLMAALIAGDALLGIARPKTAMAADSQATASAPSSSAQRPGAVPTAKSKPSAARQQSADQGPAETKAGSYIDSMKSAGLGDLSIDELIALKTQDVTPEYVRGLREQGVDVDINNIIAMRVQDVTPEYIKDFHAAGLKPNQNQLVALKVQGADAAYYRGLKDAGVDADVDRLIAMKVQDVTPEYVRELHASGFNVTAHEVIAMKVQDVTPAYLKQLRDLGLQPSAENLIAMRVQDVSPEWVRGIQATGLKPGVNDLIAMRVQDVTQEYIKALQDAGFKVGVNDVIDAKVQDVTPEFINRAKQHGFKDLTLDKLIQLRQLGILDSKAEL